MSREKIVSGDLFLCCDAVGIGEFADALLAVGLVSAFDKFELLPGAEGYLILPSPLGKEGDLCPPSRATSRGVRGDGNEFPRAALEVLRRRRP